MGQKRILLAEDEEHLARLIVFKLEKDGFQVTCAQNGAAAWDMLQRDPKDIGLLILDVMMPVMGGLEVLKQVKAHEQFKSIPVLMLSAKGFRSDIDAATELGANQYLRKPFEPSQLVTLVRQMLEA